MTQLQVQKLQETQNAEGSKVDDAAAKLREVQQQATRMTESISTQEQQQLLQRRQLQKYNRTIKKLVAAAEGVYQPGGGEQTLKDQLDESREISQVRPTLLASLGSPAADYRSSFPPLSVVC